ncbi:MAG: methyltransferase dimerization domain-containing protein, partial [Pseudomonadota bacterium]
MNTGKESMSTNPAEILSRIATGYMASASLYVAAHLRVADHLIGGSKSVEELAAGTGANADALYRILRLLVSLGVFEQV